MQNSSKPHIGSSAYYALRFSPQKGEKLMPLWAFFYEIDELLAKATENSITSMKLQWWQQEIERTFAGKPQHPVAQNLLPLIKGADLPQSLFQTYLQARIDDLEAPCFKTYDELISFFQHYKGSEMLLYATALDGSNSNAQKFAMHLAISLSLIRHIVLLGQDLSQGRIYLPQDDLDYFKIDPVQLLQKKCSVSQLNSLLLRQSMRAHEHYFKAMNALDAPQRYAYCSLLNIAKIRMTLLEEIERTNFNVLHQSYRLSALRKLWFAWRNHAMEKKLDKRLNHANRKSASE